MFSAAFQGLAAFAANITSSWRAHRTTSRRAHRTTVRQDAFFEASRPPARGRRAPLVLDAATLAPGPAAHAPEAA